MAGYSPKSLLEKLGIKQGDRMIVINAPENYFELLKISPLLFEKQLSGSFDFIHLFCDSKEQLERTLAPTQNYLKKGGMLWVSWHKQSSRVETDLNENSVRACGLENGLVDVKVAAFDEEWSALKFVYRLRDRV